MQEKYKDYAFYGAALEGDVDAATSMLNEGANPNFKPKFCKHESIFEVVNVEISKLLIDFGYAFNSRIITRIFKRSSDYVKEIVPYIISKRAAMDERLVVCTFPDLLQCQDDLKPFELEIFNVLLEHGLPVDEHQNLYTPLHLSVLSNKPNFVSKLIDFFILKELLLQIV